MSTNVEGDLFSNFVREDDNKHSEENTSSNNDGINSEQYDDEENYIAKLKEMIKEYSDLEQQEESSDDELIKFTKDKDERLIFRLGRLLEKKKKQRKRKSEYEEE